MEIIHIDKEKMLVHIEMSVKDLEALKLKENEEVDFDIIDNKPIIIKKP